MRKLAIFVEGQTEQIFVEKLIREVVGNHQLTIKVERVRNKKGDVVTLTKIHAKSNVDSSKFYVLIRDCSSDTKVKSYIKESLPSLRRESYDLIIGLRDVFPSKHSDIPKLKKYLNYGLPTSSIPISIILAIMEVEAWFIAEPTHYERIDPKLTLKRIKSSRGFDPSTIDVERINHPSKELDEIYKIVGRRYKKHRASVQRTVRALDYAEIYLNLSSRIPSLSDFITSVNSFI